jgi:hypothetical protein
LRADAVRLAAERRRAAVFACRDSPFRDAARCPSRFNARLTPRERVADGRERFRDARVAAAALRRVLALPPLGGASFTPARLALDKPIAMACLVDRAPCFPSRT